jgi:hypothetical protein
MKENLRSPANDLFSASEVGKNPGDEPIYWLIRALLGVYLIPALLLVLLVGSALLALEWLFQKAAHLLQVLTTAPLRAKGIASLREAESVGYSHEIRRPRLRNRPTLPARGVFRLRPDSKTKN